MKYWWENAFPIRNEIVRQTLGELLGTFILMFVGTSINLQISGMPLTSDVNTGGVGSGNPTTSSLGWGLAVFMAIVVVGSLSGAHINPAVTTSLWLGGLFPGKKVLPYVIAQIIGAGLGSIMALYLYFPALILFDPLRTVNSLAPVAGTNPSLSLFVTFPRPYMTNGQALLSEILATWFLLLVIFAVSDPKNTKGAHHLATGAIVSLSVTLIGIGLGGLTGFAINPARDFGPRLFTAIHYGFGGFTAFNFYFWVPIVGPLIGGALGGLTYIFIVQLHWPRDIDALNGKQVLNNTSPALDSVPTSV